MDTQLHRLEALPGEGRYAVTFRRSDGGEQTAIAQVGPDDLLLADAALPDGWTRGTAAFAAAAAAVRALEAARRSVAVTATLRDVDGGWDVGLGNVSLGTDGVPTCAAHGPMGDDRGSVWSCGECGARAELVR